MKTSVRFLAVAGRLMTVAIALLVVAQAAMAQNQERGRGGRQGGGRFGGGGGGGMFDVSRLLQNDKVKKELEITDDQISQIRKIADSAPSFQDLQDLSQEERRAKREESRKKIEEVLLPHQKDRLKELQIQLSGIAALLQPEVAEKLNLSDEQKEKIGEVVQSGFGGGGGFGRGRNQGGERPSEEERAKQEEERAKRTEERNKKAMDILTQEQQDQFAKMKGKKTDITFRDLMQGFGGGRGGEGRGRGEGRGGEGRGRGEGRGDGEGRGEGKAPRDA